MKKLLHSARLACIAIGMLSAIAGLQAQDGIYADFTTSMGSFTCRLEYAIAPKAAANFIGLATGHQAWLEAATGRVITNSFYNGLLIHRVATNVVIQGGSPTGQSNGTPGYTFPDEFSGSLRYDAFGVLAMANSGPNSNSGQIFIAMAGKPEWNDNYTIFGRVVGGSNVVYAINHVPTDANERPLTDVVIQSVTIRRVGAAAQAFDIHAQNLPIVTGSNLKIAREGTNVSMVFSNRLYADNRFYSSTNLTTWSSTRLGIDVSTPIPNTVTRAANLPRQFYRVAQVQYPSTTFAPKNLLSRTLTLNFNDGSGTMIIVFNSSGSGSFTLNGGPGLVTSYSWLQEPYRGFLSPILYSNVDPMVLRMDFQTITAGTFSGSLYYLGVIPLGIGGSFTLTGP